MRAEVIHLQARMNGQLVVDTELPAFTVPRMDLMDRSASLTIEYLDRSAAAGSPVSLADLALYFVSKASLDPKEV